MKHVLWRHAQTQDPAHVSHIPTAISMINCTSHNVGFPRGCQAALHMASQIKADSHSVPLSPTLQSEPTSNQSSSSAFGVLANTVTHTGLPQSASPLSLLFSFGLWEQARKRHREAKMIA